MLAGERELHMSDQILGRLQAFYEGLVKGDLSPGDALFDYDHLVMREPAGLPYGGEFHGREGLQRAIGAIAGAWKRIRFTDLRYAMGDDMAVVNFTMHGISRTTEGVLAMPVCEVWTFRDGRAVEVSPYYWDTHEVRRILRMDVQRSEV
jgi:ketosteroid isomerase-like protein